METIRLSDPFAEETLIGLLLTGCAEVYQYSADIEPGDFENPVYQSICRALTLFGDVLADWNYGVDVPVSDIAERLEQEGLTGYGPDALPLSWFAGLAETAVVVTNRAIEKLEGHRIALTLRESVSIFTARVKVAAANREDRLTGNFIREAALTAGQDDLTDLYEALMLANGDAAEYLSRFKEEYRLTVLKRLIEQGQTDIGTVVTRHDDVRTVVTRHDDLTDCLAAMGVEVASTYFIIPLNLSIYGNIC